MKNLTQQEKEVASQLKARLWLAIAKIVEEESQLLEGEDKISATPKFVASLVELVYNQALSLGEDLESFARHANRKTITPQDMFMVTRRNEDLTMLLREYLVELNSNKIPGPQNHDDNNNYINNNNDDDDDDDDFEMDDELIQVTENRRANR